MTPASPTGDPLWRLAMAETITAAYDARINLGRRPSRNLTWIMANTPPELIAAAREQTVTRWLREPSAHDHQAAPPEGTAGRRSTCETCALPIVRRDPLYAAPNPWRHRALPHEETP